jgi:hypothetical protein
LRESEATESGSAFWRSLLLLYAVHAASALWTERALWLDGAYYFTRLLENQGFVLGDGSRAGADVLVQIPIVVALRAGLTDLPWLKLLFALPPFLMAPLSLGACLWMAGPRKDLLIYPLATLAAGLMNTELLVIHESRAAAALFWPALFGLVDPLKRTSTLAVGFLAGVPFIASYESAVALGPILIFAAVRRTGGEDSPARRRLLWAFLTSAVFATLVAAQSILRPTHPANLASFESSWRVAAEPGALSLQLSLFVLALLALAALFPRAWHPWVALSATVVVGLAVLQALSDPEHVAVTAQYRARVVNVVLPIVAALPALFIRLGPEMERTARRGLGLLFAAQVVFQLQLTSQWHSFREESRERLACVRGLAPVDLALRSGLERRRISPEWMHGWHHPTLSLLDRAGSVRALLGRARGYTEWQPFDPLDPFALPRLERYGIDAGPYRSAVDSLRREKGIHWEPLESCPAGSPGPKPGEPSGLTGPPLPL